jgi:methionyl-tRNA formyltransferase
VAQVEVALNDAETYSKLYANLIVTIPDLLTRFADFLTTPGSKATPQDQSQATYFRNDREIHRRIFWSEMDAWQIHNLVRACEGSAFFWQTDFRVLVLKTEPSKMNRNMTNGISVPAGTVVDLVGGAPVVAARKGFVTLVKVHASRPGKDAFAVGMVLG